MAEGLRNAPREIDGIKDESQKEDKRLSTKPKVFRFNAIRTNSLVLLKGASPNNAL